MRDRFFESDPSNISQLFKNEYETFDETYIGKLLMGNDKRESKKAKTGLTPEMERVGIGRSEHERSKRKVRVLDFEGTS